MGDYSYVFSNLLTVAIFGFIAWVIYAKTQGKKINFSMGKILGIKK